jgi:HAD superfamily hydrolase (TIGR01509 family)
MGGARPVFRAVVFDMDGLLLDTERPVRAAWLKAAASLGVPMGDAEYATLIGLNHVDSGTRLLQLFGGDAARLAAAAELVEAQLDARFGRRPFDLKPGALALLRALHGARVPCAVASSTHRGEVRRRLGNAGLLEFFVALCGGDEIRRGKPAPDLYALALSRLGAAAATTLAFEDSGHGVQAALAAGLAVVAVPDLVPPEPAWQARCLAVLPSLEAVGAHGAEWFGLGVA